MTFSANIGNSGNTISVICTILLFITLYYLIQPHILKNVLFMSPPRPRHFPFCCHSYLSLIFPHFHKISVSIDYTFTVDSSSNSSCGTLFISSMIALPPPSFLPILIHFFSLSSVNDSFSVNVP